MKRNFTAIVLLVAGSIFLCGFSNARVRAGVSVNGVEVGGMYYEEAAQRIRQTLPYTPYTLKTDTGEVTFSLDYTDDTAEVLRRARRGESLSVTQRAEWVRAEAEIEKLCTAYARLPVDASVTFSKEGKFTYTPDRNGVACNRKKTVEEAVKTLKSGGTASRLYTYPVKAQTTVRDLRARTRLIASYTTHFDGANLDRAHNIALAAGAISGTVLGSGEVFSFNDTVGERTEARGYRQALVIYEGQFVAGVGGGVCQVSTTLMNAAVRAGLHIESSRAHSLTVSYVAPSCDAMVSEYCDLTFKNPYVFPVYISARARENSLTFFVYGAPDGRSYVLESSVVERLQPPPEKVEEGEEDAVLKKAREGLISESYLCVYEGGTLLSRTLFRRDKYEAVQGVRQIKKAEEEEVLPKEPAENPPYSPNV